MAGKTEWEDALIKAGVMEAPPQKPDLEDIMDAKMEAAAKIDPLESKTLDQLNEMEDDLDDEVLESYRKKRLAELHTKQKSERFGVYSEISQTDYVKEVTEASKQCWVVCHLSKSGLLASKVLDRVFAALAKKFRAAKFVHIIANLCIPNYPDQKCPTVLLYHQGDMQAQIVGIENLGGINQPNSDTMEWLLAKQYHVFETELEEDPRKKQAHLNIQKQKERAKDFDEADDEDL